MEITEKISPAGATEAEMLSLEDQLTLNLPDDYRAFLARSNGGRPMPNAFEGPGGDGSTVHFFFTLYEGAPHYQLRRKMATFASRIPPKLLPIASDPFGNIILLDLGAKSAGAVYFWDHENESPDDDPWWDNISFIAPSFTEFVSGLRPPVTP